MADTPEEPADETSFQKALRLKQAAIAARPKPPGGKRRDRFGGAGEGAKSKPWLKR